MYRIVDDPMPPIPEEWSTTLKDFLKQCFQRNPTDRPSAEALSEHDWLKEHCEVHRVLRPKDSVPFLRRVSQELQRPPDAVRFVNAEGPRSDSRASVDPPRKSEERSASPINSGLPSSLPNPRLSTGPATPKSPESEVPLYREHSFVKTAFGKRELISQAIWLFTYSICVQHYSAESACNPSRNMLWFVRNVVLSPMLAVHRPHRPHAAFDRSFCKLRTIHHLQIHLRRWNSSSSSLHQAVPLLTLYYLRRKRTRLHKKKLRRQLLRCSVPSVAPGPR